MLELEAPELGYEAAKFPYKPSQRGMKPTFRTGLLGGVMWQHGGAALGRVAMHATRGRAGKAALSCPPAAMRMALHGGHETTLRGDPGES
jgi:hypothetical protein